MTLVTESGGGGAESGAAELVNGVFESQEVQDDQPVIVTNDQLLLQQLADRASHRLPCPRN